MTQIAFGMVGVFILGVALGGLAYRSFQRWFSRNCFSQEACYICKTVTFQFTCERCRKGVGMCHSYHLLLPDVADPAKIIPRSARDLCTVCVTPEELAVLRGTKS